LFELTIYIFRSAVVSHICVGALVCGLVDSPFGDQTLTDHFELHSES